MNVLMVCLGNICRSPLAEGILRAKIKEYSLDWRVDSAGTGAYHVGEAPDPRSIAVARKYGLDISQQSARQFRAKDFNQFDLILVMDQSNYQNVLAKASSPEHSEKVRLMLEYGEADRHEVPDPYWDNNGFELVYQLLDKSCEALVQAAAVR
ncbi:MAG: low molecular weight protein-tyrosine-phosphatase [Bacteroidota bacterium]